MVFHFISFCGFFKIFNPIPATIKLSKDSNKIPEIFFSSTKTSLGHFNWILFFLTPNLGIDRRKIELKWPNDILVQKRKISGVLLESFDNFIVAGIGLNILKTPQNETKWKTTKLCDHLRKDFSLKYIANAILKIIFKNYSIWEEEGFNFFKKKINKNINNINNKIVIKLNSQSKDFNGVFLGLGNNGTLKIKVGNKILEYYSVESFYFPDEETLWY